MYKDSREPMMSNFNKAKESRLKYNNPKTFEYVNPLST